MRLMHNQKSIEESTLRLGGFVSRQRTWKWCFIALVQRVSLTTEVSFCQHSLFTLFGLSVVPGCALGKLILPSVFK